MNADEEAYRNHMDAVVEATRFFMANNFGVEPDTVYSFSTFQYNDREALNENFRRNAKARWERREEQFPRDLENAYHAGEKMVKTIQSMG